MDDNELFAVKIATARDVIRANYGIVKSGCKLEDHEDDVHAAACDFLAFVFDADAVPPPIDVLLYCPKCLAQHIDAPEPEKGWNNPPHKSHLCHHCGTIWRPADVPTNGVAAIRTKGQKDTI